MTQTETELAGSYPANARIILVRDGEVERFATTDEAWATVVRPSRDFHPESLFMVDVENDNHAGWSWVADRWVVTIGEEFHVGA